MGIVSFSIQRITCRELPRKDREDFLMRELNQVITQATDPANFKDILTVIYIGFDCDCTTPCGYVHIDRFADEKAISEALLCGGCRPRWVPDSLFSNICEGCILMKIIFKYASRPKTTSYL